MEYTVNQLSKLTGVSIRTLHWYDKINLLKPAYYGENGYRYYDKSQAQILNKIIFFKRIDFSLRDIKVLLLFFEKNKDIEIDKNKIIFFKQLRCTSDEIKLLILNDENFEKQFLMNKKNDIEQEIYKQNCLLEKLDKMILCLDKLNV